MMGRLRVVVLMAFVGMALVGCSSQSSSEPRDAAATPEATQHEAPSPSERALARENKRFDKRTAGRLDGRACEAIPSGPPSAAVERSAWGSGTEGKEGLVTESYMAGDEHWIKVERQPLCRTICESRQGPCQSIDLEISSSAVVLRGTGGGTRSVHHSDVEVDQRVRAFHGDTEVGPYYPYGDADKIVILGTR